MIDQQTKTKLQESFQEIKPKLKQQYPDVEEQELTKAQSDPDSFVQTVAQKTGQQKEQIEQQLRQLVGGGSGSSR